MREPTVEQFIKDIADHQMTVKLDSGIYRHLRFQQPKTSNMWFDIVTWPGVLTIHGDMGTWTFSRVEDMFTFFRDEKMRINPSYWGEKLRGGVHGGRISAMVWDKDVLEKQVMDSLDNYDLDDADRKALTEELKDQIFNCEEKYEVIMAIRDFRCKLPTRGDFSFDLCEFPSGKEYCYHFIWCLYAIVWSIQQWDATKKPCSTPGHVAHMETATVGESAG